MRYLHYDGQEFDLTQWLTIADYCKLHNRKPSTVMTWIERGVVPPEKVLTVPELNNMKLLRDEQYRRE